jgi:phosphoglucomutase
MQQHWQRFGRNFYTRYDYEGIDTGAANGLVAHLQARLVELPGTTLDGYTVEYADNFAYTDPVDGSVSENQGIRIGFSDGSRIVYRLSGTGTEGATLRVYLEAFEAEPKKQRRETAEVMQPLVLIATGLAEIELRTGRTQPTVIT